jgi:uncharacterized protein YceK
VVLSLAWSIQVREGTPVACQLEPEVGNRFPSLTKGHPVTNPTPESGGESGDPERILVLHGRAQLLSSRSFQGGEEMAFRAICVVVLLSSLPIAGCGTVANLVKPGPEEGGKSPFGGVRHDVECIRTAANGESGSRIHSGSESEQFPPVAIVLFCALDLPFSLIGDALTWPYAVAYSFINQPIPTPPVAPALAEGRPLIPFAPENKEPEKKTPDKDAGQGKYKDDKPDELPLPLPRKLTP